MTGIPAIGSPAPDFSVEDAWGKPLRLQDLRGKKVVLIFLRHLGCPLCRLEIAQLRQRFEAFRARNAEVIVVVDSPAESVREAAEKQKFPFHLVADPAHRLYDTYGVHRGSLMQFLAPTAGLRAGKAMLKGHAHGAFEGSELQLPGDFVIDEAGKIVHAHLGRNIADNSPLDLLLAACGK